MKKFFIFFISFLILMFVPSIHAAEFLSGDTAYVPKEKTIEGSLFAAADTVRIEGNVNGDIFCAGEEITVSGNVKGDVICAGKTISVKGFVEGNARLAGQTVSLQSHIAKNVTTLAQSFTLDTEGTIGEDLTLAGQKVRLLGMIGRDAIGLGETVTVNGGVGRNMNISIDSLSVGSSASIAGDLTYTSNKKVNIPPGSVMGTVSQKTIEQETKQKITDQPVRKDRNIKGIGFIVTSLLLGGLLLFFFNQPTNNLITQMTDVYMTTFIRGLFASFILPIIFIMLVITIIGIPFALFLGILLIPIYFISRILTCIVLGRLILQRLWEQQKNSLSWALIVGIIIAWALQLLPVIGGIASLFFTIFGIGGLSYLLTPKHQKLSKK